ncbi:MAG: protein kinase, partial [Acidobacteriaceae bacterium]|nr:protein kinase [Acidobacteriaceae bacterium]
MDSNPWKRVEDLYHAALEYAPADRDAFLTSACGGDVELRREVESLLSHNRDKSLFEKPAWEGVFEVPATSPNTGVPLSQGALLGPYRIEKLIGAGGMGEVYLATDTRLDRTVAIKMLHPEHASRFQREARAVAALNHPHICQLFDVGPDYLVMEFIDGTPLAGPLPLDRALEYAVQIADALSAAHAKGITHRDLKPSNILVTSGGIKLLDFGLAQQSAAVGAPIHSSITAAGMVVGTAAYMSPEQAEGKPVDARSDIFSFGAVLYEMLSGRRAFNGESALAIMAAIMHRDPEPLNAPPAVQAIVARCLRKSPADRFQSMSEVRDALVGASAQRGQQRRNKVPRTARIFAAITLAAVIAIALLAIFIRQERPPVISNYVQLTNDGRPKRLVATDGSRIYMASGTENSFTTEEVSVAGGEVRRIATPSANMVACDLSADGSQLLMIEEKGDPPIGPLWAISVLGGSPRRLGETQGTAGAWSPDGKMLAYGDGSNLFVARADGSEPRKLISFDQPADILHVTWFPDGKRLRCGVWDHRNSLDSQGVIRDVSLDGKASDPLLRLRTWDLHGGLALLGQWTTDGKNFVFEKEGQLWTQPARNGFMSSHPAQPVPLTFSPMWLECPLPSKDGQKLFAVGRVFRGELVRYDAGSGQFFPFLGGISAEFVDFSRDHQWVAYVAYPEGTLWRSRADGSDRRQLTYPPGYAVNPKWSPDGRTIVFFEQVPNRSAKIFTIS